MMSYDDYTSKQIEKIKTFLGITKESSEEVAAEYLEDADWDLNLAISEYKKKGKKKPKEKKHFKVGDIVTCINNDAGKLPKDCYEFILTYKKFKVLDVSDKLNIDLGHKLEETGNPYYFSPNRFELLNGTAPVKTVGDSDSDDESKSVYDAKW